MGDGGMGGWGDGGMGVAVSVKGLGKVGAITGN